MSIQQMSAILALTLAVGFMSFHGSGEIFWLFKDFAISMWFRIEEILAFAMRAYIVSASVFTSLCFYCKQKFETAMKTSKATNRNSNGVAEQAAYSEFRQMEATYACINGNPELVRQGVQAWWEWDLARSNYESLH